MKIPSNAKERNLIKGALRRVFSRSEVRRLALKNAKVTHVDETRPRVKTWYQCKECNKFFAAHELQVDHVDPIIPVDKTLEDLTWDQVVERIWCDIDNLRVLCKNDHKVKSLAENKERRIYKSRRKNERFK